MTLDVAAASAHLQLEGVSVLMLPYDRHLAAGGPIRTDLLAQDTREAAARLAAEVLSRAVRRGRAKQTGTDPQGRR
jgi:MinD-like ATPase involved in chromosome partitioning or flagellar assembly